MTDLNDVRAARDRIAPYLRPTPLYPYPALSELVGAEVFVKHENHQPVGAFKVRGGVNLVAQLSDDERERGLVTASTGNHGQSIAYAARLFGAQATVAVPEGANPVKVASMQALGAEVVFQGHDFDDARVWCEATARADGRRYVHSANEPALIAGVGTVTLEMLESEPELDVIIVPIGGGSQAAGACITAKALRPSIEVIGVQSDAAPAAYRSWKEGRLVDATTATFAEGLATRTAFELPQQILRDQLDDFVLVSDDDMRRAMVAMVDCTRNLAEAAGAASLAAALSMPDRLAGRRVGVICSGGNVSSQQLTDVLEFAARQQ